MNEAEERIDMLIRAQMENQPRVTSDRYFAADTDTVAFGAQLTVTFTLSKLYVVRLVKAYADARVDCTYTWMIDGVASSFNEVEYYMGKPVHMDIVLIIANTGLADVDVGYYIMGWGDLRGGG